MYIMNYIYIYWKICIYSFIIYIYFYIYFYFYFYLYFIYFYLLPLMCLVSSKHEFKAKDKWLKMTLTINCPLLLCRWNKVDSSSSRYVRECAARALSAAASETASRCPWPFRAAVLLNLSINPSRTRDSKARVNASERERGIPTPLCFSVSVKSLCKLKF